MGGLFLKKCFIRLLLSKLSKDSSICVGNEILLGTKVKPKDRTSSCGGLRVLDERLVTYLLMFIIFWVSFCTCL